MVLLDRNNGQQRWRTGRCQQLVVRQRRHPSVDHRPAQRPGHFKHKDGTCSSANSSLQSGEEIKCLWTPARNDSFLRRRSPCGTIASEGTYLPTERTVRGGDDSAVPQSNSVGPEGGQVLVDRSVEAIQALWSK